MEISIHLHFSETRRTQHEGAWNCGNTLEETSPTELESGQNRRNKTLTLEVLVKDGRLRWNSLARFSDDHAAVSPQLSEQISELARLLRRPLLGSGLGWSDGFPVRQ